MGKSKVMKCSKYVNAGHLHVRLNDKPSEDFFFYIRTTSGPSEEVNCFKYLVSQVAAMEDAKRMLTVMWYIE